MPQTLTAPYRLKTKRAKAHIKELTAAIETFHAKKPYDVIVDDNASGG